MRRKLRPATESPRSLPPRLAHCDWTLGCDCRAADAQAVARLTSPIVCISKSPCGPAAPPGSRAGNDDSHCHYSHATMRLQLCMLYCMNLVMHNSSHEMCDAKYSSCPQEIDPYILPWAGKRIWIIPLTITFKTRKLCPSYIILQTISRENGNTMHYNTHHPAEYSPEGAISPKNFPYTLNP